MHMANLTISADERTLSPDQVSALDKRRQWGLAFQVMAGQFAVFAVLLTVWAGQDVTYSPDWIHPMFYYDVLATILAIVFATYGTYLKRGREVL
jgi:hypothetical protein